MFDIIGIDQSNHLVNKKNQTIFYVLSRAIFLYTCHEIVYLCQSFSDIMLGSNTLCDDKTTIDVINSDAWHNDIYMSIVWINVRF